MSPSFSHRKELIQFCSYLYQRGYMVATDGNLSMRIDGGFLTTPAGRNKGLINAEDLVFVDASGNPVVEDAKPSSEFKMHLKVYELRPDVGAVVHCHPVYATAIAASTQELDSCLLTESVVAIGSVPKAPVAIPSTDEIPRSIAPLVPHTDVLLLQNHGVLAYGLNLEQAYNRLETVEHFAKIQFLLSLSSTSNPLGSTDVDRLEKLRSTYGLNSPFVPCNKDNRPNRDRELNEIADLIGKLLKDSMR